MTIVFVRFLIPSLFCTVFFSYKGLSIFSSLDCRFVRYFSQNECPPSWLNSNLDSYIAYEKQKTLRIKEMTCTLQ